ncbi:hypothetical protein HJB76_02080 [Rhizobium lentis]|uniref:hypothetical protein n=1 Tax=Rhizobium lentis TaxID=1138194 RepID=UPI001C831268|nr:hypothetical protein [Rhizobium lentis]MBX4954283.1 hypothetical protein [Rhizobium lentis]
MKKTIHYRSVVWFGAEENLLSLISQVLAARPHVNDTEFPIGSEICEVRHREVTANEARLHISMHVPGARKAISPRTQGVALGDLSVASAPQNTEFTEREIALVVRADRVGYVISGRARTSTVRSALDGLIKLQFEGVGNRLNLSARADQEAIQALLAQGVDKFDLDLSLPHANALNVLNDQPLSLSRSIGRAVANGLSARFEEDHHDAHIDELANMNVSLTINARRKAPEAEIETLTALAAEAIEGEDEFTIRTLTKATISRDQLILNSSYDQPGEVAVLNYVMAWNAIAGFLDQIQ